MAQPEKSLAAAYGRALLGPVLGIFGLQRYYLHRYFSATVMTMLFIVGLMWGVVILLTPHLALLTEVATSLSFGGLSGNISNIEQQLTAAPPEEQRQRLAYAGSLCGISVLWWVLDLFLLPGMVRKYQQGG